MIAEDEIEISGQIYRIYGQIGEGTVGKVVTVSDSKGKRYALKIITQYGRNPIVKHIVDKQIQSQRMFADSPFIIQIFVNQIRSKTMYILFELGTCSLKFLIEMNTHIELRQFINICLNTTQGLLTVHNHGIIHRDIKPENIICVQKTYKITDFGSLQSGTVGQGHIGTPLYLSPEILFYEGAKDYGLNTDIWSLGVTLFQTYFRIHPFYYSSYKVEQHKIVYDELKRNIKALIPNFTIQKWLKHVSSCDQVSQQKYKRLTNVITATPKEITDIWTEFFKFSQQRSDIGVIAGIYESLRLTIQNAHPQNVQLIMKKQQLPKDLQFYIDTLNLFYSLYHQYGTQNFFRTEFHLELGLWFWNLHNYNEHKYLEYSNQIALKRYQKDKKTLWVDVKKALFDYWTEINTNKQLQFFDHLQELKVRVLMCGAMSYLNFKMQKFLRTISQKIKMDVETFEMFVNYLGILEIFQLRKIQQYLKNLYTE